MHADGGICHPFGGPPRRHLLAAAAAFASATPARYLDAKRDGLLQTIKLRAGLLLAPRGAEVLGGAGAVVAPSCAARAIPPLIACHTFLKMSENNLFLMIFEVKF